MADLFLVPYVRAVWQGLHRRLAPCERMAIFGAGEHTRWLLRVTADLPALPIDCVVDDRPTADALNGWPVRRPPEACTDSLRLILLSSDRWENQLAQRARAVWGDAVEIVRLYEGLPTGPYDKTDDRAAALAALSSQNIAHRDADQLVLVCDCPGAREAKIGSALRRAGWDTILLHRRRPLFDPGRYFTSAQTYRHAWEALRLATAYRPQAFHVSVHTDYQVAEEFVRHPPGPVVIDSYDLVAGMHTADFLHARPAYAEELDRERFCLEHADGVSCRSAECDHLRDYHGYRYRRYFHWPDGCWNHDLEPPSKTNAELHVVCAGGVSAEREASDGFSADGRKLWLADALARQRIHFHLYPGGDWPGDAFEESFGDYTALGRATGYVHLHRPVPSDQMVSHLVRYDLGVCVYNHLVVPTEAPGVVRIPGGFADRGYRSLTVAARTEVLARGETAPPEIGTTRDGLFPFTADKLRTCSSNKFYDYFDSALPIIHNALPGSFLTDLVSRFESGVDVGAIALADWGELLRARDLPRLRENARRARSELDVHRHVHRLIDFYRSLTVDHSQPVARTSRPALAPAIR